MSSPLAPSPAYLVSGATGVQGGSVAPELRKAGFRVHAPVRDSAKLQAKEIESLGAVLFVGDFTDVDAINNAPAGVKGIFINPWPDFTDQEGEAKIVQRFVDAARAAGTVEHLVLSTSLKTADHKKWPAEDPTYPLRQCFHSKAAAEDALRASGAKYWTILRPPWLFQNYTFPFSTNHFPQCHTDRTLTTCVDRNLPMMQFDADNMGRWVLAAFREPAKFAGKEVKLGSESLTLAQVVDGISKFTGVDIIAKWPDPTEVAKDTTDPMGPMRASVALFQNRWGPDMTAEEETTLKSYGIRTTFAQWLEKDKKALFETLRLPV